jgi:type III secretion protein V
LNNATETMTAAQLVELLRRYSDFGLAIFVVMVVALLIVPVPPLAIDIFICGNIAVAVLMLLMALYITESLSLSAFPTILLVTTLFRLSLNVATTRLILLEGHAGDVIEAFGRFVVQGNLIVGTVIFLVLMLINLLVVAKGSERVAEVAARFTLDAMPGKQMAIDADLRNGTVDMEGAQKRRLDLARESQLFGAMDGAMKFVKGDVIAGIIIFAINIIAGICIGTLQRSMPLDEALTTYTILSVGDGLVSIIPGLLMSVCAGLIVTRVSSTDGKSNLGTDVGTQLLANAKPFLIAALFIGGIGQIPGLPTLPFTILGALVGFIGIALKNSERQQQSGKSHDAQLSEREQRAEQERRSAQRKARTQEGQTAKMMPMVTPITLEIAYDLVPLVDDSSQFLTDLIPMMRDALFFELGVRYPGIRVRGNDGTFRPGQYVISVNEIPRGYGLLDPRKCLVNESHERLKLLGIEAIPAQNPASGIPCSFVDQSHRELLEQVGIASWDAPSYIVLHVSTTLKRYASEFVGIQEVQTMLEQLEQAFPALVKEVVPKTISVFQLTEVLRRLVEEEVCIRDLRSILQCLAEWAPLERDTQILAEHVRHSLRRYITHKYTRGQNGLVVHLLDNHIEDAVRASIQRTAHSKYLAIEPEIAQEILSAIKLQLKNQPPSAQQPVVLTMPDIRRFVRKLLEVELPQIGVLSYQELHQDIHVQPVARISMAQAEII